MTKPYHLTPERAEEIWSEVESNRGFSADLSAFANAVLDEVLGEPVGKVADIAPDRFPLLHGFIFNAPAEAFQLGTKLYAPRREK